MTNGLTEFEATLEPLAWGRNTYVVVRLPSELAAACRGAGTRRVEGVVEGVEVNFGLNRSNMVPSTFVYTGRTIQRRIGAVAGDVVSMRLRPVDPNLVPLP